MDMQPLVASEDNTSQMQCLKCNTPGNIEISPLDYPYFRKFLKKQFQCIGCGFKHEQIDFDNEPELGNRGIKIVFTATTSWDLDRDIIKSHYAKVTIPSLDMEIPNRAEFCTVKELFKKCVDDLQLEQPVRKYTDPELYDKIEQFIQKLQLCKLPFTIVMDDPSGNAFISNPFAPKEDPRMVSNTYRRTRKALETRGYDPAEFKYISDSESEEEQAVPEKHQDAHKIDFTAPFNQDNLLKAEGVSFEVPCHSCGKMGETKICETSIPYFSDLIIMSFHCEYCGATSSQTKGSGAGKNTPQLSKFGTKIILKHPNPQDMKRRLFKSETCAVQIPELQLQLDYGTLGSCMTTVEGLIDKVHSHLSEHNPFSSPGSEHYAQMQLVLQKLRDCGERKILFTLILEDPLGHSFLQNPKFPDADPNVTLEYFERTEDQNDFLGYSDMNVDNYKD